jgi:hypothetical protein
VMQSDKSAGLTSDRLHGTLVSGRFHDISTR